ncbi:hypothetical protein D3C72_2529070 [compost metagenome]
MIMVFSAWAASNISAALAFPDSLRNISRPFDAVKGFSQPSLWAATKLASVRSARLYRMRRSPTRGWAGFTPA